MKKVLNGMKFGKSVIVNELLPTVSFPTVAGFEFEINEDDPLANAIVGADGNKFSKDKILFRLGNNVNVSLRNTSDISDYSGLLLGSLFPDHNIVIGSIGTQLVVFAPICNSKMELASFLTEIDRFFIANKSSFAWYVHDLFVDLALWLYKNNPGKKIESSWGI